MRGTRTTSGRPERQVVYSDIADSFRAHPSTGAVSRVLNENSVRQSIKNLIMTDVGERPYSSVGGNIRRHLFDPVDPFTALDLKSSITETIFNHEPRVSALRVEVNPDFDNDLYNVTIVFTTRTIQGEQSLELNLTRVR